MKKISVCIPTYNGEKYLRQCLDSILGQTCTDFEIIIVDDCSTDSTINIIKDYSSKYHCIKYYQNSDNLGLVKNWNRCLELAEGEWIKFVFQDDLIASNCLEKMLAVSDQDIGIVYCQREFIFETGISNKLKKYYTNHLAQVNQIFRDKTYISSSEYCQILLDFIYYPGFNLIGEPTVVMFHYSIIKKFGKFNENLIQIVDEEYWTRIAINQGIIYVPETLAKFRLHSNSATMKNQQQKKYRLEMIDPLIRLYNFVFEPNYQILRDFALKHSTNKIDLSKLLKLQAYKTYLKAKIDLDRSLMLEWQKILAKYPLLSSLINSNDILFWDLIALYFKQKFSFLLY